MIMAGSQSHARWLGVASQRWIYRERNFWQLCVEVYCSPPVATNSRRAGAKRRMSMCLNVKCVDQVSARLQEWRDLSDEMIGAKEPKLRRKKERLRHRRGLELRYDRAREEGKEEAKKLLRREVMHTKREKGAKKEKRLGWS